MRACGRSATYDKGHLVIGLQLTRAELDSSMVFETNILRVPPVKLYSQCNKRQARAQNFFAPISINLVPKVV